MPEIPDTRKSLILRLRRAEDAEAWEEFVAIYEPVMVRMGRRRGMQDADIQETIQQVFMSVATAIVRWSPDAQGRFRSWLTRIFRNQMIDHFRQVSRRALTGARNFSELAEGASTMDPNDALSGEIEQEYRRRLFQQASALARSKVESPTWEAFFRTSVAGEAVEQVAAELGMSAGAVYAARSRVMARIRRQIQAWEARDAV